MVFPINLPQLVPGSTARTARYVQQQNETQLHRQPPDVSNSIEIIELVRKLRIVCVFLDYIYDDKSALSTLKVMKWKCMN